VKELVLTRFIALLLLAVVCAYTDMARGKLYNPVVLGALALGFFLAAAQDALGPGFRALQGTALAAFLGGGLLGVVYLTGGMGAGDAKYMAAVGALSGSWVFTLWALTYAALLGAALGVGVLIWQGRLWEGLKRSGRMLLTFKVKKPADADAPPPATIPFGVAISGGVIWAWTVLVAM
jgi:Flp pilus assembly protein protease CpaA